MKKYISLILAVLLSFSVISGCTKDNKNNEKVDPPVSSQAETPIENGGETENPLPEESENKEVVSDDNAPKVFVAVDAENEEDRITYHLEGCKHLKDGEPMEVAWEYVKLIGFWQCPDCNPPRYEGYLNAE